MKKLLLLAFTLFTGVTAFAQTADEIAIIQSVYGMDKRAVVTEQMKLNASEASAFWPVYEQYEVERKELGKRRVENIVDYAKNYQNLSDEKATEMLNKSFDIQSDFVKLQQKTFKQMSKVITPARAAQFSQIEMYLENAIRAKLGDEMPFIEHKH